MGDTSIAHTNASLPSRVVVELPSLRVIMIEPAVPGSSQVEDRPLLELFAPATAAVVTEQIVSALLDGEVWSGELLINRTAAEPVTAMTPVTALTLWIPHQGRDEPP